MKGLTIRFLLALAGCGVLATPAAAQFGSISKGLSVAKKANDAVYTEAEKQQLGAEVSANIRKKFGVVQDESVHRYVTLVGAVLARVSKKPDYPWRFIVLDTDAVNAFAAPGGYIHITKGCLALIANESELAGVLGHELVHVTRGPHRQGAVEGRLHRHGGLGERQGRRHLERARQSGHQHRAAGLRARRGAGVRSASASASPPRPATSRTGCARSCSG